VSAEVSDQQIRELAATAEQFSIAILEWGPNRGMAGADAIELEHQRRMVSLRADGVIAVLCPVGSDQVCGVAVMTAPLDAARDLMADDPCVQSGMMTCQVYPCHGFPGDAIPAVSAD
jgi:hypothetical protein